MNIKEQNLISLQSLKGLINALYQEDRTNYNEIIRSANIPTRVFKNYSSWSKDCYTRNCIVDTKKFELMLLCWEPGQITPIHDHGGEECWVKIVEGKFREKIYCLDEDGQLNCDRSNIATPDDVSYMIDSMGFHSLENISKHRSISLHLYAKPIRSCQIFEDDLGKFERKKLNYDTTSKSFTKEKLYV